MTLPVSGTISMSQMRTEFGLSGTTGMADFYGLHPDLPATGTIAFDDFHGLTNEYEVSDPFWASTQSLVTLDTASTVYTNEVSGAPTLTAYAGTEFSPSQVSIGGYYGSRIGRTNTTGNGAGLGTNTQMGQAASSPLTVEFWAYTYSFASNAPDGQNYWMDTTIDGSNVVGRSKIFGNGGATYMDGNGRRITGAASAAGVWNHYAVTRNAGGSLKLWLNGVQTGATETHTGVWNTAYGPRLGFLRNHQNYTCDAVIRMYRITDAERYTGTFTPFKYFYHP